MFASRLLRAPISIHPKKVACFSTSNLEHVQERFPYVFGNNLGTLVKTRKTTNALHLKALQTFVSQKHQDVNIGFFLAYKCLLEALESNDRDILFDICEGNLYHKFSDALDLMQERNCKLKLLNKEKHRSTSSINADLSVIDFQNFAGCRIDRKTNKENGLKEASPFFVNLPNITIFMPSNPFKMSASFFGEPTKGGAFKMDSLTIELQVAIKSNLKLDLVDKKPEADQKKRFLTPSQRNDDEIHFVKFEGRFPVIELSMEGIKDQRSLNKITAIEDWTITDFDNCLEGNPHI